MFAYAAPRPQEVNAADGSGRGMPGNTAIGGDFARFLRASAMAAWATWAPGWPAAAALAMFFTWRADFGLKLACWSRPDALRTCSASGLGLPLVSSFMGSSSSGCFVSPSAWRSGSLGAAADGTLRFLPGRQPRGLVAYA